MNPVFCPNPACPCHQHDTTRHDDSWWIKNGWHMTAVVGRVPRFKCCFCKKTFSTRTFQLDYYTKKTIPYKEILERVPSGESVSAIARNLKCSVGSAQNRIDRLGRNCVALHESLIKGHSLNEDLVADGFESFDRSQYFPNNINILVGKDSQTLYAATHVTMRRKGQMTSSQRKKRMELEDTWKAPAKGIVRSFGALMTEIPALWDQEKKPTLTLSTDEHNAYPFAIRRVPILVTGMNQGTFRHKTYSSKAPRTVDNPLFAVNYYDRELRKDLAAYHRESTCFCRNVANGRLRFALYQTWHNYRKRHRIVNTREKPPVHAVVAGMDEERIETQFKTVFRDRVFLSRSNLSQEGRAVWLKQTPTPFKARPELIPKYQKREH